MRRGIALLVAAGAGLIGCGRVGFGGGDDGGGDDGVIDAPLGDGNGLGGDDGGGALDATFWDGPPGCTGIDRAGRRYMLCTASVTAVAARAQCAAAGMQLIRIDDAAENLFVRSLVDPLPNPQAWIGASDELVEDEWRWADGTQFWQGNQTGTPVGGLFTAWASSAPDDQQGGEDCAESIPVDALWLDEPCDDPSAIDVAFCEQL